MLKLDAFDRGYFTGVAVSFACWYFFGTPGGARRMARWLRSASDYFDALSTTPLGDLLEPREVPASAVH